MIVGLPGSGKTSFAKKLVNESRTPMFLATDFSAHMDDILSEFNPSKYHQIVVTDPMLCGIPQESAEDTMLEMFRFTRNKTKFTWIYFENDAEACIVNTHKTPRLENLDNFIHIQSKKYTIPEGSNILPVYRVLH